MNDMSVITHPGLISHNMVLFQDSEHLNSKENVIGYRGGLGPCAHGDISPVLVVVTICSIEAACVYYPFCYFYMYLLWSWKIPTPTRSVSGNQGSGEKSAGLLSAAFF